MSKFIKKAFTILFAVTLFSTSGCSSDPDLQYKTHVSTINQTGTNPPTEFIIRNTLNLDIIWTRLDAGHYKGTLSNPVDLSRTTIFNSNIGTSGIFCYFISNTEIALESTCGVNVFCDEISNLSLQITVYE
jgi:hypothetical protein